MDHNGAKNDQVSRQVEDLVGLQAQFPLGMRTAIPGCQFGIPSDVRTIHRLEKEMGEIQIQKVGGVQAILGVHDLQFIA